MSNKDFVFISPGGDIFITRQHTTDNNFTIIYAEISQTLFSSFLESDNVIAETATSRELDISIGLIL